LNATAAQRSVSAVPPVLIKKYGNRRLYDTGESRYLTLDELAAKIRSGLDVRIIDAKTNEDLTQATLAQIILESGSAARVLPVGLLTQLIRLGDDALGEFFGRYVSGALDLYLQGKRGAQQLAVYNPVAQLPIAATDALARMFMGAGLPNPFAGGFAPQGYAAPGFPPAGYGQPSYPPPAYAAPQYAPPPPDAHDAPDAGDDDGDDDAPPEAPSARHDDLAAMRRELDELKRAMRGDGGAPPVVGKPGAKRKPKKS
jgi:polyhydroxyalkanoate synthesis repressor PhaR